MNYKHAFAAITLIASASLLLYCAELGFRVLQSGQTHVGSDVIVLCYVIGGGGLTAACLHCLLQSQRLTALSIGLVTLACAAVGIWLLLHLSNRVISYERMTNDKTRAARASQLDPRSQAVQSVGVLIDSPDFIAGNGT